jgi:hypothetical protein
MKKYLALALFVLMLCALLTSAAPVMAEEVATTAPDSGTVTLPIPDIEVPQEAVTKSEEIVAWIQANLEEISVFITMILTIIYNVRRNKTLDNSVKTLNNNSVAVAETSKKSVEDASATISGYSDKMDKLLTKYERTAEENEQLHAKLDESTNCIRASKLANKELANVVAELLVLANIPNSKKEELYSRHLAANKAIAEAEKMEVKEDVAEKA